MATTPATRSALRQVGLTGLTQVHRLDTPALSRIIRQAGARRVLDKGVWDALLYRTAILCLNDKFKPLDIAFTLDAMAKVRSRDKEPLNFLLAEARKRVHAFKPASSALLLNAFAKLSFQDEIFVESLLPPLLRNITEKTRWEDLALLSLSCARLDLPGRELINDRIVAVLSPRIGAVNDGQSLSMLACAFTRPYLRAPADCNALAPLFTVDHHLEEEEVPETREDSASDAAEDGTNFMPHSSFVGVLLEQCERHMFSFRGGDAVHLCLALANLHRKGHERLIPARLVKRLSKCLDSVYVDMKPAQFVRLLEVLAHIPDLEKLCADKVLSEIAYCARDLTAESCLSVLHSALRSGNHRRVQSAMSWRLTNTTAVAEMTPSQVADVAEAMERLGPLEWEDREALLTLLQCLQERQRDPDPQALSRLLRAYGEAGVRDTHWFALCKRLGAAGTASAPAGGQEALAGTEAFNEEYLANAVLALAQLNFPQLVDEAGLFSRAASWVTAPAPAVKVLEAAAIFDLIERRPHDLLPSRLKPLVAIARSHGRAHECDPCRLFPYSDLAAVVCGERRLQGMRIAASERYSSEAPPTCELHASVKDEFSLWSGVEFTSPHAVGPIVVPWAVSIEDLAEYVRVNPLGDGAGQADEPPQVVSDSEDEPVPAGQHPDGTVKPTTHILIELLRPQDFYHTSPTLRGEKQRAKGRVLKTSRFAELRLLRRHGWRVCCVAHHSWRFPGTDLSMEEASRLNRALIFNLVASLDDDGIESF